MSGLVLKVGWKRLWGRRKANGRNETNKKNKTNGRNETNAGGSAGNLDVNAYVYGKYDNTTPLPGHNKKGILVDGNLKFVIEMSDIYPNGDGWYTDMWES